MRKIAAAFILLPLLAGCSVGRNAYTVNNVIGIDGSRSITPGDFSPFVLETDCAPVGLADLLIQPKVTADFDEKVLPYGCGQGKSTYLSLVDLWRGYREIGDVAKLREQIVVLGKEQAGLPDSLKEAEEKLGKQEADNKGKAKSEAQVALEVEIAKLKKRSQEIDAEIAYQQKQIDFYADLLRTGSDTGTLAVLSARNQESRREYHRKAINFQDYLIRRSNQLCDSHRAAIFTARGSTGFLGDIISNSLTTAGTLVGGELTKSIFSGLATASNSGFSSFEQNFMFNYLAPALTREIDILRAARLNAINSKRASVRESFFYDRTSPSLSLKVLETTNPQALFDGDYNPEEIVLDVEYYHRGCSLMEALDSLVNKDSNQTNNPDTTINNLRSEVSNLRNELRSRDLDNDKDRANAIKKRIDVLEEAIQALVLKKNGVVLVTPVSTGTPAPPATGQ